MKSRSQERDFIGSSRARWKSKRSLEVLPKLTKKSRSLPKKLIKTHQEDRHEVQELAGSLLEHCQEIVGSSPEACRKKPRLTDLFNLVNVLKFVIST